MAKENQGDPPGKNFAVNELLCYVEHYIHNECRTFRRQDVS